MAPQSRADEKKAESPKRGDVRLEDPPQPIPELPDKLQGVSRKIEPEITKLGSKLGQELDETVKKLREELPSQRRRNTSERLRASRLVLKIQKPSQLIEEGALTRQ